MKPFVDHIHVSLEMPTRRGGASVRSGVSTLGYLQIGQHDTSQSLAPLLVFLVDKQLSTGSTLLLTAANPRLSVKELAKVVGTPEVMTGREEVVRMTRDNKDMLQGLVANWQAEQLVLLFCRDNEERILKDLQQGSDWWKLRGDSLEGSYLVLAGRCDPIVFYDESHASVEFFGSPTRVWSLLDAVRDVMRR